MSIPNDGQSDSTSTGMTTAQAYEFSDLQKIEVDINSLSDFAYAMRREYESLRLAWDHIIGPLGDGAQFGFAAELDLAEKRSMYAKYLDQARVLLSSVMEGTNQLSHAADQIAANYSRADQFARLQADDVTSVLPEIKSEPLPQSLPGRRAI
jgi:hypothetical protein